jgi:hypothetical protein
VDLTDSTEAPSGVESYFRKEPCSQIQTIVLGGIGSILRSLPGGRDKSSKSGLMVDRQKMMFDSDPEIAASSSSHLASSSDPSLFHVFMT